MTGGSEIPENSSLLPLKGICSHSHFLVSGGIMNTGQIINWVVGYKFQKDEDNVFASLSFSDGSMGMPEPRMMH